MTGGTLYIFCEGYTEADTLRTFLQPYWSRRFVACEVIRYVGSGGLMVQFAADAKRELTAEPGASVLCLIDLYKEPFNLYKSGKMSHRHGFELVKQRLEAEIPAIFQTRFGAFPVVMEVETWLLSDQKIQQDLGVSFQVPEDIEHPAEALRKIRPNYKKRIDGIELFRRASAKRVYDDNCPHFKLMIDWLINPPAKATPPVSKEVEQREIEWQAKLVELRALYDAAEQNALRAEEQQDVSLWIEWSEKMETYEKAINTHCNTRKDLF